MCHSLCFLLLFIYSSSFSLNGRVSNKTETVISNWRRHSSNHPALTQCEKVSICHVKLHYFRMGFILLKLKMNKSWRSQCIPDKCFFSSVNGRSKLKDSLLRFSEYAFDLNLITIVEMFCVVNKNLLVVGDSKVECERDEL